MSWNEIYTVVGTSPWAWLALPAALVLPFLHAHWRSMRKAAGVTGDIREGLSFLVMAVLYFILAAMLASIADGMSGNSWEVVPVYLFKAGIPVYLLFMLFKQLIDAYF